MQNFLANNCSTLGLQTCADGVFGFIVTRALFVAVEVSIRVVTVTSVIPDIPKQTPHPTISGNNMHEVNPTKMGWRLSAWNVFETTIEHISNKQTEPDEQKRLKLDVTISRPHRHRLLAFLARFKYLDNKKNEKGRPHETAIVYSSSFFLVFRVAMVVLSTRCIIIIYIPRHCDHDSVSSLTPFVNGRRSTPKDHHSFVCFVVVAVVAVVLCTHEKPCSLRASE